MPLRRGLPVEPRELGRLDPEAIERVRGEVVPDVRDPDELHDVLLALVAAPPREEWEEFFEALAGDGRCFALHRSGSAEVFWAATERRGELELLFPDTKFVPDHPLPPSLAGRADADEAGVSAVQGHLETSGPVSEEELASATGLSAGSVKIAYDVILFRALEGRLPFTAPTAPALLFQHANAPIPSLTPDRLTMRPAAHLHQSCGLKCNCARSDSIANPLASRASRFLCAAVSITCPF